ncbi:N-carbamoyl-L-amino-acid hydrolase [Micromonospora mirobrigensis]|uniref:N-carbamoyl-L-amino-acid hydrolase n=2 Tax=Micromonospora mirobrigensis TaxID=262898 RepID=A0A1C4X0W2_9ACTN|nr:N-carbamoyl-L-amino-acid hydrolase [Micromonospora mirobrigensis]
MLKLNQTASMIDRRRFLSHLAELARFGADELGGVSRTGFSEADHAARRYLCERSRMLRLRATVDAAGNLFIGRREADRDRPVLLFGSHLDSVVHGGRLDGAYGVVAALETLARLDERDGSFAYEPVAVAFANEEGAEFGYPFFGSKAMVGPIEHAERLVDSAGLPLRDALRAAGGDIDALSSAVWPAGRLGGFLELHIEQGPVLQRAGVPLGLVEAITGRHIFEITLTGEQNHAGTTPMDDRHDALVAGARLTLAIEDIARVRRLCAVSTVGRFDVRPNVTNVIPGAVTLTVEIRDGSLDRLANAERAVLAAVAALGPGIDARVDVRMRAAPVRTDHRLSAAITDAAAEHGLPVLTMHSGAGHDAQIVAAAGPVGMIFVPSRDGISHSPREHTEPEHLLAGADVLLTTVRRLLEGADR